MYFIRTVVTLILFFVFFGCQKNTLEIPQTYTISLERVNTLVNKDFPISKETKFGVLTIVKPDVFGTDELHKVSVVSSFFVSNILIPDGVKGEIFFSYTLQYKPQERAIYLTQPIFQGIKMQSFDFSEYLKEDIEKVTREIISKELTRKPMYRVNKSVQSSIKDVVVKNENLMLYFGL